MPPWKLRYEAHLAPLFVPVRCPGFGRLRRWPGLPAANKRPSVEFKQAAGWKSAAPADTALRGDWWTLYDDPELDALIARLNADNQNLASAEAKYRQAQALVRGARASFFPTLGLNTGVTRAGQGGETAPSVPPAG